jgi:hypothetical protein
MWSATIGAALDALPVWLLPIVQVYRVSGVYRLTTDVENTAQSRWFRPRYAVC